MIKSHKYSNNLTLVVEEMPERVSAAFDIVVDAGASRDPEGLSGAATVLSESILRGAGPWGNIELNEALDRLGIHFNNNAGLLISSFSGVMVNNNFQEGMKIFSEILLHPHLADEEFENCQELSIQALESLDDDPRQKVSILAKETYLNSPYNRPVMGRIEEIEKLRNKDIKGFWHDFFTPANAIITVAGGVKFEQVRDMLGDLLGSWSGASNPDQPELKYAPGYRHLANDGSQTHINLTWPSVHISNPDYYKALLLSNVLSGGMGSRLFTEVREKRGLCYSVSAHQITLANKAAMTAYVGSSPEKAQEALDVILAELAKLPQGVSQDELDRAKVGLRASLIMQGESSSSRSVSLASDYLYLKRTRTLSEIEAAINNVSLSDLMDYIIQNPAGNFSLATIGPKEVTFSR
ncbi:MAG: insulinase family protein [Sedimentisphaerales bacterium]|nr:insulinase family protein [Sedimentisphaerales bacterium]MBN2844095.1 insulinase family protein [Sedimentisphaerales bacterium]